MSEFAWGLFDGVIGTIGVLIIGVALFEWGREVGREDAASPAKEAKRDG
jgi:hypothetical protein